MPMTTATRHVRWISWFDNVRQDVRLAIRMLRRSPGFAVVVVLTLGLGIGANAAIFSVINSLLLRPLPVTDPQRLYTISADSVQGRRFPAGLGWNVRMWERLAPHVSNFDGALAWMSARFDLATSGERQPVEGLFATGNYFTTLGVPALLGRTFTAADDRLDGGPDGPVAVISYRLWQRQFGGAASVIGTRMLVDGVPVTIVGVTPPEFLGVEVGRPFNVALPLRIEPLIHRDRSAVVLNMPYLAVMLRLKPDQPVDASVAFLRTLQPEILGVTRETMSQATPARLRDPFTLNSAATGTSGSNPFVLGLRQSYQRPLLTVAIVVGLVLLIACVNIANLMLARATARRHEMSVRLALGAPRLRLARQMLIESLMLSGLGALLGILLATWGSRALVAQLSTSVDHIAMDLSLDWRVTIFTAAIALATAAIFGTAPAFRAASGAPIEALKASGRTAGHAAAGARRRASVSSSLVVAQVSLALALVIVAALFVRTFERIASVPLGFQPDRVLLVNVNLQRARVTPADRLAFSHRLVEAVRLSPGVAHAGASMWTPIDRGLRAADPRRNLAFNFVTPGWFAAYGTAVLAGRDFDTRDTAAALPVAIVNQTYVRKFVTGGTPIGARVTGPGPRGAGPVERTIVGVVDDAVFSSQREGTQPMAYLPLAQTVGMEPPGEASINISLSAAGGTAMGLARSVATALTAVDSSLSFTFRPLADQVDASLTQERLVAMLSGIFGALALLIAAVGLYGVTSYAVQRRSSEIGIRMALGAQRGDVLGLVLRQSLTLTAIGIVLGLAAAAAVTRYVRSMLFGLTPLDPATFIGVAVVFALVATAAAAIPARRATKVDPLIALRTE
jgi:putative ABC transport system permease protein